MRTHVNALAWWLGIGTVCLLSLCAVVNGQEGARLETLDQYTRLQIPVSNGSAFRMLNGKTGEVTLTIDRVATGALDPLPSLSDSRIKLVSVKTLGLDKAEITVRFQDPSTESFAYAQGNNIVLDLWHGAGKAKAAPAPAAAPVIARKFPTEVKGRVPAAAKASVKVPATEKVPEPYAVKAPPAPPLKALRIEQDLFHHFVLPMPELRLTAKDGGLNFPLDLDIEGRWKFTEGDKESTDGKGFNFAKRLYAQKKYGLSLKTIEIVLRDHPKTPYADELKFLRALAYRKLGEATKTDALIGRGDKILQELAAVRDVNGDALPFARLIVLNFARTELADGKWLEAIPHLEYVASQTSVSNPEFPYVQMLMADAYGKVGQPRRAERLYRYLAEKYPKHPLAFEAKYRIADLLAIEKKYSRVVDEGEDALHTFPAYEKARAEVVFNVGEAYFWLGQYAKAEKYFRRFVTNSSAQTNASLAWVRLGEIAEVSRGDLKAARDDYFHAKNGYPFSKGDLVASVRLARIDLPTEKDPRFVIRTLQELSRSKEVDGEVKRMAELTLVDYLLVTGDTDQAVSIAATGMGQTEGKIYELYKHAYEKSRFAELHRLVSGKKYGEALALYEREKMPLEDYGPETFHALSEAYRGLGLYASANKLMERYTAELAKGTRSPSSALVHYSREKAANSFAKGSYTDALEQLGDAHDSLSEYMRAISHYRMGHKADAFAIASRLLPSLAKGALSDEQLENLAEVAIEHDSDERDFARMEKDVAAYRALCAKDNERLLFAAGDALWYQKKLRDAEKGYREALEKFPKGIRSDRGRYNLGMVLVAEGKRDEAVKLMTELQNSGQSVWAESAKQELELIEWERKYSSVLKTLPPSGLGIAN